MSIARRLALVCATILTLTAAACTPGQITAYQHVMANGTPAEQAAATAAVDAWKANPPYETASMGESPDCYAAIARHWPAGSQAWARGIVSRESGNQPGAQNASSTAAGCFQMLRLHEGRFNKLGYTWADRYDPDVNTLVALDLYREAGTAPWRL